MHFSLDLLLVVLLYETDWHLQNKNILYTHRVFWLLLLNLLISKLFLYERTHIDSLLFLQTIEMIEKEQREVERRPITKITHKGEIEIESETPMKEQEVMEIQVENKTINRTIYNHFIHEPNMLCIKICDYIRSVLSLIIPTDWCFFSHVVSMIRWWIQKTVENTLNLLWRNIYI